MTPVRCQHMGMLNYRIMRNRHGCGTLDSTLLTAPSAEGNTAEAKLTNKLIKGSGESLPDQVTSTYRCRIHVSPRIAPAGAPLGRRLAGHIKRMTPSSQPVASLKYTDRRPGAQNICMPTHAQRPSFHDELRPIMPRSCVDQLSRNSTV